MAAFLKIMHNYKNYAHAFKILHNCEILFCFLDIFFKTSTTTEHPSIGKPFDKFEKNTGQRILSNSAEIDLHPSVNFQLLYLLTG